jgi:hypothetical protein
MNASNYWRCPMTGIALEIAIDADTDSDPDEVQRMPS